MKKTALVIIAALAAFSAGAQDRAWTLGDCIRYAIDHNISLKQSRLNVEQKELDLSTAKGKRLPGLAASASENLSFGRGLGADNTYTNSNTTSTSLNLGADIPIFQGFSISDGIKISSLDLSSATQKLRKAENDLSVNVAKAYIQILYDEEVLKVALSQEACDKELLESVRARMESGKASLAEVASQEAVLAQSSLSVAQARGNLSISRLDLRSGQEMKFDTESELLTQTKFRCLCLRQLHKVPRPVSEESWSRIISKACDNIEVIYPDSKSGDFSTGSVFYDLACGFFSDKRRAQNISQVYMGRVFTDETSNEYVFTASTFVTYMRDTKNFKGLTPMEMRGKLEDMGAYKVGPIWRIPTKAFDKEDLNKTERVEVDLDLHEGESNDF